MASPKFRVIYQSCRKITQKSSFMSSCLTTDGVSSGRVTTMLSIAASNEELCGRGWGRVVGNIQGVSRLEDITAGADFPGLCDQNISYKHVSDFGRLRSYGHF